MSKYFFFLISIFLTAPVTAQIGEFVGDEQNFYAATKQVNQFLRRFNGEEDLRGVRYSPDDANYHNPEVRRKYINILFDNNQKNISTSTKSLFMNEVIDTDSAQYLDLHGGNWFAQVSTKVEYEGEDKALKLFLKLQKEPIGSKWVIHKAYFEPFNQYFEVDTADKKKFIHPMSHELDFMNLKKIFNDTEVASVYTNRDYLPDHLSLVLYEMQKRDLIFKAVEGVKFHFFQLDNWYFEITEFNRSGPNTGWLISNLLQVDSGQKEQLRKFIYYEEK